MAAADPLDDAPLGDLLDDPDLADPDDGDDGTVRWHRGAVHARNRLNALSGNEWLYFTKSVLRTSYPAHAGQELRRRHGANKPPYLMRHLLEFMTQPGGTVLDPFCGVGGTLLGATLCGRRATGVEVNPEWVDVYRDVCARTEIAEEEVLLGDCRSVLPELAGAGRIFDCIATDPPYSIALDKTMCDGRYDVQARRTDFDSFGDAAADLRNLPSFDAYYAAMEDVARLLRPLLRPAGYCAVIMRDSYQGGRYVFASAEVARRFEASGFVLKGVKVWYGTGARVRPYGYPNAYVPNIVHQNILILRRED
ncbi:MAG TPA: DNA methyltransferase [Candidatus Dormibacteraeota bacterium]|nr:DNA methyltransferase [Candidatus Dormibacteraeota bacterium]